MNKVLITIFVAFSLIIISCGNKEDKKNDKEVNSDMIDPENPPVMTFEDTLYDFGTVSQGEKVKHTYYFKNTGKSALVIQYAEGSCGCTIPSWPKEPIAPGEEGKIEVSFNSEYRKGPQSKTVTIVANTDPIKSYLKLTGNVLVPEKDDSDNAEE